MNVGQILETHLGWAAKGIGWKIEELMTKSSPSAMIKKYLKDVYGSKEMNKFLDTLEDDELMNIADRLKRGVPMASPVFEGASETQVQEMLEKAGMSTTRIALYSLRLRSFDSMAPSHL